MKEEKGSTKVRHNCCVLIELAHQSQSGLNRTDSIFTTILYNCFFFVVVSTKRKKTPPMFVTVKRKKKVYRETHTQYELTASPKST